MAPCSLPSLKGSLGFKQVSERICESCAHVGFCTKDIV